MIEALYPYINGTVMTGSGGQFVDVFNSAVCEVRTHVIFVIPPMD